MRKFLHLSDRHIFREWSENEPLVILQEALNNRFSDHILLESGDITDDGEHNQYRRVQWMMADWQGRWFFCPGNHDYGKKGNFHERHRAERFDKMLSIPFGQGGTFCGDNKPVVNVIDDGQAQIFIIALDSNRETVDPFDFACGEIGHFQLKALSVILAEIPKDAVKIVLMHHHPWYHWNPWNPFMRLIDAQALLTRLRGKVDVLLFGHRHKAGIWQGKWNIPWSVAAPSSPGHPWLNEIVVDEGRVEIGRVSI